MTTSLALRTNGRRVADWRLQQSDILDAYIDAWLEATPQQRLRMPYRIDLNTAAPQYLRDADGQLAAEVRYSRVNAYLAEWVRSLADLRRMEAALEGTT